MNVITNRPFLETLRYAVPGRFRLAVAAFVSIAALGPLDASAQSDTSAPASHSASGVGFPALPSPPDTGEATRDDLARVVNEAGAVPSASAVIEKPAADADLRRLPVPPAAIANFDDVAAGKKPLDLALPTLPEAPLSADVRAEPQSVPIEKAATVEANRSETNRSEADLGLPPPPDVVVSFEAQTVRPAYLRLDFDETKLRAALEPMRVRFRFKASEIDGFVEAYSARDFRPYWLEESGADVVPSPKVEVLAATVASADKDGLDPLRLAAMMPLNRKGPVAAEKQAATDLQYSVAAFLYARDARGGRLEPSRLSALITPTLELPSPRAVLDRLAAAEGAAIGTALQSYNPQHAGYRALRTALAKLREELSEPVLTGSVAGVDGAPHPSGTLPPNWMEGNPLAFDKADPRVSMLRLRLNLPVSAGNVYDQELREAVKAFQKANELAPNARITPKTSAALENPHAPLTLADRKPDRHALVRTLLANMERWRWLPSDLGKLHVFVNVANFDLNLVQNSTSVFKTRVIVGKPQTQTPIFSDEMEHLIVNPSWGVPASIIKKEFLPKMASDPEYAARRGFQVVRRGNSISIRQPPGERNALGLIKFIFPNQHSVYLHDTPNRNLFGSEVRTFSHGCVRVDKPFVFAEKLLTTNLGISEQQLRGMVGRGERMLKLTEKIPVHLTYFTVFADETGAIQQRKDLYGHDTRVLNALRL